MAFWGDVVVHWVVLVGGGQRCDGQRAHGQQHLGGCCCALGGVVGGEAAVRDRVEAVGERRCCDGPLGGGGPQSFGTMQRCNERCCQGSGGGATDNGGDAAVCLYFICT